MLEVVITTSGKYMSDISEKCYPKQELSPLQKHLALYLLNFAA